MATIKIYTKNGCIQCKMTKRFLSQHHVDFDEININEQPESLDYLKAQGFQSLPIVMAQTDHPIVGFRPDQLQQLVH